ERYNEVVLRTALELTHHSLLRSIKDTHNAPFKAPVSFGANHLNFHAVTIHGGVQGVRRNKNVLFCAFCRLLRHDKTVAIAMTDQAATYQPSAVSLHQLPFGKPGGHRTAGVMLRR